MSKTLYLTTPLYYVNAAPHIGHSYTNIAADALARHHRLAGQPVFLLTGTDEHGQKIAQAAAAAGETPQAFADRVVAHFTELWTTLGISHDDFIRTTQPRHIQAVQTILTFLHDRGQLLHKPYHGWYCTPDETFWTQEELHAAGPSTPLCPSCQRPLEAVQEEGWHLPLEPHRPWLRQYVKEHPAFIRPESRYNELARLLEEPLPESLCITRPKTRVSWGIPVPFSPDHVTYVWFDALLNYITVPGYPAHPAEFRTRWPADVHLIGKDILRHHALYWPIILRALGLDLPRMIFAHGWWKIGEQKMSKSLGNIVDPFAVIRHVLQGQPYAADIYRYFLLREIPFGQDGSFSEAALTARLDADLANDLGNLVNRTLSMIERYTGGMIPAVSLEQLDTAGPAAQRPLAEEALQLSQRVAAAMERLEFSVALEAVMTLVAHANQFVEAAAPWKLAKAGETQTLARVLGTLAEILRIVSLTLEPFMPAIAAAIWQQLGCGSAPRRLADAGRWPGLAANQPIGPHPVLFLKVAGVR